MLCPQCQERIGKDERYPRFPESGTGKQCARCGAELGVTAAGDAGIEKLARFGLGVAGRPLLKPKRRSI